MTVDKVQSASQTGTVRRVNIVDLVRLPEFQVREAINPDTVETYACVIRADIQARQEADEGNPKGKRRPRALAAAGDGWTGADDGPLEPCSPFPPIKVAIVSGAWVVVDGFHRIAAHEKAGLGAVDALIFENVTEGDAKWMAARANMKHGLPLCRADLPKAFKAFIAARQHVISDPLKRPGHRPRFKSYAAITRDFGGHINKSTTQRWMRKYFPSIARAMGQDDRGTGEQRGKNPEERFAKAAMAAISAAKACAKGVRDPDTRWAIIKAIEEAAEDVKGGGLASPPEF